MKLLGNVVVSVVVVSVAIVVAFVVVVVVVSFAQHLTLPNLQDFPKVNSMFSGMQSPEGTQLHMSLGLLESPAA